MPITTGAESEEGAMAPPQKIFSIFHLKRRVLVDSDVLNVPVTRIRVHWILSLSSV